MTAAGTALRLSLALVLTSVLVVFTMVRNPVIGAGWSRIADARVPKIYQVGAFGNLFLGGSIPVSLVAGPESPGVVWVRH